MAKVWAHDAFNINKYNFSRGFLDGTDAVAHLDSPLTFNGQTYQDRITTRNGTQVIVGGYDFVVDLRTDVVTSGTVTGLIGPLTSDRANLSAGIQGISVSLKEFASAAFSATTGDDFVLLGRALSGADSFRLSDDADIAKGFGGNDAMKGGRGDDLLYGNDGHDDLLGEAGNDKLDGGAGNDKLIGGSGNDTLVAGTGRDTLTGGTGQDKLQGGTDGLGDVFDFNAVNDSRSGKAHDTIYNFSHGADHIDLSGIDARTTTRGTNETFRHSDDGADKFSVWWSAGSKGKDSGVLVQADVTGDAVADLEIWVSGATRLSVDDFVF